MEKLTVTSTIRKWMLGWVCKLNFRSVGVIETLNLGPDDRIILTCEKRLSAASKEGILRQWQDAFGEEEAKRVIVLDDGMTLKTLKVDTLKRMIQTNEGGLRTAIQGSV